MSNIEDKQGRLIKYLRLSVTDRCNYKCRYCVPHDQDFKSIPCHELLRYEDLVFAVECFAELGLERVRVTGGEPLVRKNITHLLEALTAIKGIKEVSLTTNATILPVLAAKIAQAGVKRINISLDSLQEERYKYITGGFSLKNVTNGIAAAKEQGMAPIKINCVAIRGFNDDEILDFCGFAANEDVQVRFIEFMPIGNSADWKKENIITGKEIVKLVSSKYTVAELPKSSEAGPAKNYKLSNGAIIGIITPMSDHFCTSCDKIRFTADGKLRPCLLSDKEVNAAEAVRSKDKEALRGLLMDALSLKEPEHSIGMDKMKFRRTMSKIGG